MSQPRIKVDIQIEQLLDTTDASEPASFIVQTRSGGPETQAVLRSAYLGLRSRSISVNPADCLPPTRGELEAEYSDLASELTSESWSLSKRISWASPKDIEPALYIDTEASRIQHAIEALPADLSRSGAAIFGSASSFGMTVSRDVLSKNREALHRFAGIFPNQELTPPNDGRSARPSAQKGASSQSNTSNSKATAWGLEATGATRAWGAYEKSRNGARGKNIKVAVLDSGIDAGHPDLAGKVITWAEFDAVGQQLTDTQPHDPVGHGTHVAGIIAGGNASGSHIGMAPDAKILAARIFDDHGRGTLTQLLAGFDWALRSGAHIINLSLGTLSFDNELAFSKITPYWELALVRAFRAGVSVVAAIGNEGHQTTNSPGNHFLAFAVGGHDREHRCAAFSGGTAQVLIESEILESKKLPLVYNKPEISAPGVDIYSCFPRSIDGENWRQLHGTSMATPHVSGAIAQLLSASNLDSLPRALRASTIRDLIIGSCHDRGEIGQDQRFGFGCLDVYSAIEKARELDYCSES